LAETKTKEAPVVDPMVEILNRAIPPKLQERLKELEAEHEDNYRVSEDMVAVLDISTNAISLIDGVPPSYDIVTGSDEDKVIRGADAKVEFTKQMLRISDRYPIMLNHIPQTDYVYKFTVIPLKQWHEYAKDRAKGMITPAQEISGIMLRSGGTV